MPTSADQRGVGTPAQALFQCAECKRTYTRLDHLSRHVRSHTKEKPFVCDTCLKPFARADLMKRHAAGHSEAALAGRRPKRLRTSRISEACEECAELHLKCEEVKPCKRCQKKGVNCRFASSCTVSRNPGTVNGVRDTGQRPTQTQVLPNIPSDGSEPSGPQQLAPVYDYDPPRSVTENETDRDGQHVLPVGEDGILGLQVNVLGVQIDGGWAPATAPAADEGESIRMSNELLNMLEATNEPSYRPMNGVAVPGTWTPRGVTNFGLDTDLEFNEADFSFLETYNQSAPFEPFDCRSASDRGLLPDACEARAVPSYRGVALGAEAFRKSVWRFTPVSKDCATSEQENISLPLRDAYDSPESHIGADRRATAERLSQASRDAILAMVLQASKPESRRRLTMSFPSTELLDTLLQYYLTCPFSTASSWLHFPSFDPNKVECPELLTGMIATGAALAPDSALNKLGFALQEVLRTTLSVVFEEDNTRVRNLQLWQTFLLVLQVGLWSGNSRKIEIAESFLQPLVTMVRRSGSFRRSSYAPIVVQPDDDEKILAQRWKDWVRQESYKRFVYHLFQHDTQVSMCLMVNPLISYAEMHLPLPESRELWLAESAEAWKYALMRVTRHIYSDRHISLVEGIKQIDCFSILGPVIDRHESRKALLYGLWRLVWEYRQFSSLIKVNTNHYGLIMSSRFQELHQSLQNFRICCDEPLAPTVDSKWITLTLELVFMHLHMSMEDVQVFAGLEGEADAKRIYPSLCSWFNTSAARQAIWHAGQVVRVAKLQASRHLRGFYSVALYHSTLAFWAYGVILQSRDRVEPLSTEPDSQPTHSDPVVWLDGPENVDVKRFVSLNRGSPALQDPQAHGGVALISIPPAVMDIVIKTLQDNHDHDGTSSNGSRPPLIENLVQLLRGLQSGSRAAAS